LSLESDSILGAVVDRLVARPLHWLAWASGAALLLAVSFGRFEVQPFADEEWTPKTGRPTLYSAPATAAGIAAWAVASLALFRHYGL